MHARVYPVADLPCNLGPLRCGDCLITQAKRQPRVIRWGDVYDSSCNWCTPENVGILDVPEHEWIEFVPEGYAGK